MSDLGRVPNYKLFKDNNANFVSNFELSKVDHLVASGMGYPI